MQGSLIDQASTIALTSICQFCHFTDWLIFDSKISEVGTSAFLVVYYILSPTIREILPSVNNTFLLYLLQKSSVPKFRIKGRLDSTSCCITKPFEGQVRKWQFIIITSVMRTV